MKFTFECYTCGNGVADGFPQGTLHEVSRDGETVLSMCDHCDTIYVIGLFAQNGIPTLSAMPVCQYGNPIVLEESE